MGQTKKKYKGWLNGEMGHKKFRKEMAEWENGSQERIKRDD